MTNQNIQAAAKQIDAYFNSLLYEGMPLELAIDIEQRRNAAHAELTWQVMAAELDGWQ